MNKAIFLVGAPGSGKDFLLRSVLENQNVVEISLDKLYNAILQKEDIQEVNTLQTLVINGNADRQHTINTCSRVLEVVGYQTSMIYVYTTNESSKIRNDARIARGSKTFTEEQRRDKYDVAINCLEMYSKRFDPFWIFDNSADINCVNEQVDQWLEELEENVISFLNEQQKFKSMGDYNHAKHPPQAPAPNVQHQSNLKGYERVKDITGRWILRRKQVSETAKYNSLNQAFETYTATVVDNSRGNTRVSDNGSPTENPATVMAKVLKPKKKITGDTQGGIRIPDQNRADPPVWESKEKLTPDKQRVEMPTQNRDNKRVKKTVSAIPPPDFFDSKMGMVPSGSLGITAEFKPSGTSLSELRKRMRK